MTVVQVLAASYAPGHHLAYRPTSGVFHLYAGPLTPSQRYAPRAHATVCKARTRRLTVCDATSLLVDAAVGRRRACKSCSARLPSRGRAEHLTRDELVSRFGDVEAWVLATWAFLAATRADVELVHLLAYVAVGFTAATKVDVVAPTGKVTAPLFKHVDRARRRLGLDAEQDAASREDWRAYAETALENLAAEKASAWREREALIARVGASNALPDRPYRKHATTDGEHR